MKHVFTTREKVLMLVFALLLIALTYWKLILTPINDSIEDFRNQTASEQDLITENTAKVARLTAMKKELAEILESEDAKPLPSYNNEENLLIELNGILLHTNEYSLSCGSTNRLEEGSKIFCRPINMSFTTDTYADARVIVNLLQGGAYVNQISNISINIDDEKSVETSLTITYFELENTKSTNGES